MPDTAAISAPAPCRIEEIRTNDHGTSYTTVNTREYDRAGRVIREIHGDGGSELNTFTWDGARVVARTLEPTTNTAWKTIWTPAYGADGAISSITIDRNGDGTIDETLTLTWKGRFGVGGPVATDPVFDPTVLPLDVEWLAPLYLDFEGALTITEVSTWPTAGEHRREIEYDAKGRRVAVRLQRAFGSYVVRYVYDDANRLVRIEGDGAACEERFYDSAGRLERRIGFEKEERFTWADGRLVTVEGEWLAVSPGKRSLTYTSDR